MTNEEEQIFNKLSGKELAHKFLVFNDKSTNSGVCSLCKPTEIIIKDLINSMGLWSYTNYKYRIARFIVSCVL